MICLDIANGYSQHFVDTVRKVHALHAVVSRILSLICCCFCEVRAEFPDHIIMAGNVVTNEMTEELIMAGQTTTTLPRPRHTLWRCLCTADDENLILAYIARREGTPS